MFLAYKINFFWVNIPDQNSHGRLPPNPIYCLRRAAQSVAGLSPTSVCAAHCRGICTEDGGVPLRMSRIHPECRASGPSDRLVVAEVLLRQEPDEEEDEEEDEDDGEDDDTDDGYSE